MQTYASQQYNQPFRIAAIAIGILCAAVIAALLGWPPTAIGRANDYAAHAKFSVAPAQPASAQKARTWRDRKSRRV
jgi:hypothetical protein